MPDRRRVGRRVAGILGVVAVVAAIAIGSKFGLFGLGRPSTRSIASARAVLDETSPLADVALSLRAGNHRGLFVVQNRLARPADAPPVALSNDEAGEWLEVLAGLRTGFVSFNGPARAISESLAFQIFNRFAVEPAPAKWDQALQPLSDLFSAGMADSDPNVRAAALGEVAKCWGWLPGRSITPAEEMTLANWKEAIYRPVVRCLGHRDPQTLVAAVACLGSLPIDHAAAPALAYLENDNSDVRKQTMLSFARRNLLMTDDMLLKRLHDADSSNCEAAALILTTRGLTREQIRLGSLIFSPKPQQRISVIPYLKDRTDLDPVVWLIQLSRDSEEMVRISAIEPLAAHKTPGARKRLAEMARSDRSPAVRQAAGKLVPAADEKTASLPPLPGSPSLNPRAN